MLVYLHHVARVRNDPQAPAGGMRGDLKPLGDSAHARSVDLDNAHGVGGDETGERLAGVDALAGRDVRDGRLLQSSVALEIVRVDGLLDPVHTDLFEHRQHAYGGRQLPPLIRVAHERDLVADRLADGTDAVRILTPVGLAYLHFHPAPAMVDQRAEVPDQVLELT